MGTLGHELRSLPCSAWLLLPSHEPVAATMPRGSAASVYLGVDVGTGSARAGSLSDSLLKSTLLFF